MTTAIVAAIPVVTTGIGIAVLAAAVPALDTARLAIPFLSLVF